VKYAKAIVPLVVGVVMLIPAPLGITEGMSLVDAITVLLTSGLVYLVPNKQHVNE
jgi:hypothetical protein